MKNKQKVYLLSHPTDAGKWIYNGFYNAWKHLGYEPIWMEPKDLIDISSSSFIMSVDSLPVNHKIYERFDKVFLYVMNQFSDIFQGHPNFTTQLSSNVINDINNCKNIIKYNFGLIENKYIGEWTDVQYVPLAFDNVSYKNLYKGYIFDVCFVGGLAHNGVNTKLQIMKEYLGVFKDSGLRCGFFLNKNISHEQENKMLCNSKICLNIHDKNQHIMGLDTNERTFKSLGCGGCLVSDNVRCLSHPPIGNLIIHKADSPQNMVEICKDLLTKNLEEEREHNFEEMKNHTYMARIKQLLQE